jgi:uncharacterized membrane protein YjjB (DUF3815 family)
MSSNLEYARLIAATHMGNGFAVGEPVSRRRHRPGTRFVIRPNIVRLVPGITHVPIRPNGTPA